MRRTHPSDVPVHALPAVISLQIFQEISTLAGCHCPNITEYYGSVLQPGSTELMIVMELLACSVADLVGMSWLCCSLARPQPWRV